MPLHNPVASERQFKRFAKRVHARLGDRAPALGQLQDLLLAALGHAHLHAARQFWAQHATTESPALPMASWVACGKRLGYEDLACFDGVIMDEDVYAEGWAADTIYPPCSCHPRYCPTCRGQGQVEVTDADGTGWGDCPDCTVGWRGAPAWPQAADPEPSPS